ncbi:MAG: glycerol-3-phosphate acyltransferase [Dehalococcoidales bacterium]|nr:glycerol-3-phosphate acyltransferase [Dehalococcoidales bacterium]
MTWYAVYSAPASPEVTQFGFIILAVILAYLIGSFPSAYLMGRFREGIDIRRVGSRNMGAMNVFYEIGFIEGLIVLALDIGKGAGAVALARYLGVSEVFQLTAGVVVIFGHMFPPFLGFRGGRGGATSIGVLAYVMPWGIPFYLATFGLLLLISRYATLSYGIALVSFLFVGWLFYHKVEFVILTAVLLLILGAGYIPRLLEMRAKAGDWRRVFFRKSTKERL